MRKILIALLAVLATLITFPAVASNRVLSLDGDGDYVEVADSESLNAINSQVTMEAWIKAAKVTGDTPIVFKEDKFKTNLSNRSYYLCLQGDGSIFLGSAPTGIMRIYLGSIDGLIALNTWYHVAGVVDTESGVMRILVNGVEVAHRDSGKDIYMSALPLRIGWTHEEKENIYSPFAGQMDEVRIWNIARTQEEIQVTMHTTLSGKEPGLVGYWRFDDLGSPSTRKEGSDVGSPDARKVELSDSSPGHADGKMIGDAHLVEARLPGANELAIPTAISGVVADEAGKPISDALVYLEQDGSRVLQTQTDNSGNYRMASYLKDEVYDLYATKGEHGDLRLGIPLREGEFRELNFTLKEAARIEGTVLMMDGKTPHVAVPVQAFLDRGVTILGSPSARKKKESESGNPSATALTDENGRYRLVNLRPGSYRVRCHALEEYAYYREDGKAVPEPLNATSLRVNRGGIIRSIDFRLTTIKKGTWKTYNVMNGLSHNRVTVIYGAPDGVMWVGTDGGGVSRYDGNTFVNLNTKDGLINKDVYAIHGDTDGITWFGTRGGISHYDGKEFVNFTTKDGLANDRVNAIHCTPDGILWFGTQGGISRYDGKEFVNFTTKDGLAADPINAIYGTPDGILWLGTPAGISRYDGKEFAHFTVGHRAIYSIHGDTDGTIWFGTDNGVLRYDGTEFTRLSTMDGLVHNTVNAICGDTDGVIWFGTEGGVSRYDGKTFVNFTTKDGLAWNNVWAIQSDADGVMWIGTMGGGVSRYDDNGFINFTTKDGLVNGSISSICRVADNVMWFGAWGSVSRYDGKEFANFTTRDGLTRHSIFDIYSDKDGIVWFASLGGGVFRYDGKEFVNFTMRDGLVHNRVGDIHCDANGVMWFATDVGVSRYDGNEFVNFTEEDGLLNNFVQVVYGDADGVLWFGTDRGVSRYDGKGFANFTTEDGLLDHDIHAICQDNNGSMWFGTEGGLSRYDGEEFVNFTVEDGLPHDDVRVLYFSSDGVLWVGTYGGGVAMYDGNAWGSLDTRDGLAGNSVRSRSFHQDEDGTFWFGTNGGITRYRRGNVPPKANIVSVTTDQTYDDLSTIPAFAIGTRVTIECSSIDLKTIPEKRQYRYRVYESRNLESHIPYNHPTKEASFDWVPEEPGTYTFQVQAIDRDLRYSKPASLTLEVVSPFYMRTAFLVPVIGVGFILLLTSIISLTAYARRHRQVQAYQRLAVQELQDAHEMQMSLLPEAAPPVEGMEIAGRSIPANTVGGDFFDYLSLTHGKVGIAIADVSGNGLRAAMNAVLADGILHDAATTESSCGSILSRLNSHLCPLMEKQMFTAFSFVIIDQDTGVIQWSNAGQPLPLIKRGNSVSEAEGDGELPLGIMPDVRYTDYEVELQAGDMAIFYTDGIIEAENADEEMYGTDRLLNLVAGIDSANTEGVIEAILAGVAHFVGSAERYDDMTVVVLKKA